MVSTLAPSGKYGVTDIIASMTSQQRYLPFGQVRTDVASPNSQSLITDFGYTGQRNLDESIGLMDYRARFYSPLLNRFIQPDTIVPGMYNPQNLNRFSYVVNNPINLNDPTGHVCVNNQGGNDEMAMAGNCGGGENPNYDGGLLGPSWNNNDDEEGENNDENNLLEDIIDDWTVLENQCAETGYSDLYNNSACLDYYSVMSQDVSTISSGVGAFTTAASTIIGCFAGAPAGVLAGCAGGYALGLWFHLNITNYIETGFNFISFGATVRSDFITGDNQVPNLQNLLNPRDWLGEDTITASHTFIAGSTTTEPFLDFGIDIYSSGYNHGYFCGMSTILNCFSP